MNVQRKPHPHSIEVILGLTETNKQNTQSFRPYCRQNKDEENLKNSEYDESFYTRLVPRLGLVPQPPVMAKAEFTGRTLNTEQRLGHSVFKDSANIKGDEEVERYPYRESVTTAENTVSTPLDNRRINEYERTIQPGNTQTCHYIPASLREPNLKLNHICGLAFCIPGLLTRLISDVYINLY
jgi:hypothetical protein